MVIPVQAKQNFSLREAGKNSICSRRKKNFGCPGGLVKRASPDFGKNCYGAMEWWLKKVNVQA
jgi:hypothetical protein